MKPLTGYMAGVNLGGWISQYKGNLAKNPDTHFDTFVTEEDIRQIASWGMDHVRLPFDYSLIEWDEAAGKYNDLGFIYMDKCVEWCKKYGLNVMLDMHQAPGFFFGDGDKNDLFDNPKQQDRYEDIWLTIVKRYRNEGQNVMFELLNEIVEKTPDRWNMVATRVLKAIRTIDDEHYVVIGGIDYNSPWRLKEMPIFDDDKVVYNFHMYSPMALTHQRASWHPHQVNYPVEFVWPSPMKPYVDFDEYLRANNYSRPIYDQEILHRYYAMDKRYITDFLTEVDQFLEKHDVPMYCGEYGVIDCSDLESRTNWTEDVSDYCLARGIGRAIWSYRGMNFTMVDEEGKAIHPGLIKAAAKH